MKQKPNLSKNELIRTITTLRNQLSEWRQGVIHLAADLLLIDPQNEVFKGEYFAENTVKQIISMAAERLDYLSSDIIVASITRHYRLYKPEEGKPQRQEEYDVNLSDLVTLFKPFRELQVHFKDLINKTGVDKAEKAKEESALMDLLDVEMEKLYFHFTGKQSAVKPAKG